MTLVPVDSVSGVDVTVLTVLTVGVVKKVDVAVLAVETESVVPVVVTGVLSVVADSVVNVVGVVVVSVEHMETHLSFCTLCTAYVETTTEIRLIDSSDVWMMYVTKTMEKGLVANSHLSDQNLILLTENSDTSTCRLGL